MGILAAIITSGVTGLGGGSLLHYLVAHGSWTVIGAETANAMLAGTVAAGGGPFIIGLASGVLVGLILYGAYKYFFCK